MNRLRSRVLTRARNPFSQQEELLKCDDEEELKSIYHMLDRNRDGGFSHAEIRLVFNEIGGEHAEITDEEINEMIWEADMSGDGEICYREFKTMAEELGMIKPEHQAFRRSNGRSADDEEGAGTEKCNTEAYEGA